LKNSLKYKAKEYRTYEMEITAAQVAALIQGKTVFFVNIEVPAAETTTEMTLEAAQGGAIDLSVEEPYIIFTSKTQASFAILKNAQITVSTEGDTTIIATFAANGGLQIKARA
jgi:hypothetical protein